MSNTATPAEVEWAYQRASGGYANDFICRHITSAGTEAEAVTRIKHFQNGGGCGEDAIGKYWFDCENDGFHAWFGERGEHDDGSFKKGERHALLKWAQVVRRIREEASGVLF